MSGRARRPELGAAAGCRGFSLMEVLITLVVLGVTMTTLVMIVRNSVNSKIATANAVESQEAAAASTEMISRDLRSAGYGVDLGYATHQPVIAYVDSMDLILCGDFSGSYKTPVDTLAYDPTGTPKPVHLTGLWTPPMKYKTGAELIRWTLDVNNDGAVDNADIADSNGVDARRTRNPNDYILVRQIYADSLNLVAKDNGGAISRVALVRRPGSGVPPLFSVYFKDGSLWNWSSGAVPASKLVDISDVKIQIVATSSRPDVRGRYSETTLATTVNVLRNTPD